MIIYADLMDVTLSVLEKKFEDITFYKYTYEEMKNNILDPEAIAVIVKAENYDAAKTHFIENGIPVTVIEFTGNLNDLSNKIKFALPKKAEQPTEPEKVYIEKEVIRERIVEVEKKVLTKQNEKLIVVTSVSHGSGATLVSMLLSEYIANKNYSTALIEFSERPFIGQFYDLEANRTYKNNISYDVKQTEDEIYSTSEKLQKLITFKNVVYKIVDNGISTDLLNEADIVLVVMDLNPSQLLYYKKRTTQFAEHNYKRKNIMYISNKDTTHNAAIKKSLKLDFTANFPYITGSEIIKCVFDGIPLLENKEIISPVETELEKLWGAIQ